MAARKVRRLGVHLWKLELSARKALLGRGRQPFHCLRLDRRIPNQQVLKAEVEAWEADRNSKHAKANWQFTTEEARVKLKRLYPAL